MHLVGHVCLGLMWARMAKAAYAALDAGTEDREFHETKIATGRYYMARQLPATAMHLPAHRDGGGTGHGAQGGGVLDCPGGQRDQDGPVPPRRTAAPPEGGSRCRNASA